MPSSNDECEDKLLGAMMGYLMQGKEAVNFKQLSKDLGFMERTKSWRNSWKTLIEDKGFIEAVDGGSAMYGGDYRLTQAGKDHGDTPEYQEFLKELNFVPQSNDEHQERLKKRLLNDKARTMFDLLVKHGNLSRKELSLLMGVNPGGHAFSYGLKDLKDKGLAVVDCKSTGKGKELVLTNMAFLDPTDRPRPVLLDPKDLKAGAEKIESRKRKKSGSDSESDASEPKNKKGKSTKKVKAEEMLSPPKKKIKQIEYKLAPRSSDESGNEESESEDSKKDEAVKKEEDAESNDETDETLGKEDASEEEEAEGIKRFFGKAKTPKEEGEENESEEVEEKASDEEAVLEKDLEDTKQESENEETDEKESEENQKDEDEVDEKDSD